MAGRKTLVLTDRQFEVLSLLWEHGPQTVRELLSRLARDADLPYTTVLGLLQSMEKAGLVAHDAEKRTHRYRPLVSQAEATGNLLTDFLKRFFQDSAQRLILGLVHARRLSPTDLQEIERRLELSKSESSVNPPENPARRRRRKS